MTLVLNQIFSNSKSGIITLTLPVAGEADREETAGHHTIKGFLVSDPTIQLRNQWGSIMPDMSDLNNWLMVAGQQNLYSWVSASAAAWKSCDPFTISLDFYLLSLNKKSHVKADAGTLLSLAAMSTGSGEGAFSLQEGQVQVHGGYKMDLWTGNEELNASNIAGYLESAASRLAKGNTSVTQPGTITINIGDQMTLRNMLLDEVKAEHSAVQVEYGVPLYIKISATFRLYRAPLVSDIIGMYNK